MLDRVKNMSEPTLNILDYTTQHYTTFVWQLRFTSEPFAVYKCSVVQQGKVYCSVVQGVKCSVVQCSPIYSGLVQTCFKPYLAQRNNFSLLNLLHKGAIFYTAVYCSVVYKGILQCSVVQCSCVSVTWNFFLVM